MSAPAAPLSTLYGIGSFNTPGGILHAYVALKTLGFADDQIRFIPVFDHPTLPEATFSIQYERSEKDSPGASTDGPEPVDATVPPDRLKAAEIRVNLCACRHGDRTTDGRLYFIRDAFASLDSACRELLESDKPAHATERKALEPLGVLADVLAELLYRNISAKARMNLQRAGCQRVADELAGLFASRIFLRIIEIDSLWGVGWKYGYAKEEDGCNADVHDEEQAQYEREVDIQSWWESRFSNMEDDGTKSQGDTGRFAGEPDIHSKVHHPVRMFSILGGVDARTLLADDEIIEWLGSQKDVSGEHNLFSSGECAVLGILASWRRDITDPLALFRVAIESVVGPCADVGYVGFVPNYRFALDDIASDRLLGQLGWTSFISDTRLHYPGVRVTLSPTIDNDDLLHSRINALAMLFLPANLRFECISRSDEASE